MAPKPGIHAGAMLTPSNRHGAGDLWVAPLCPHCERNEQGWVRTPDPAGKPDWSRCPVCNDPTKFEPRA